MSIHTVVQEDIQPAGQCAVPVLEDGHQGEEKNEIYLGKMDSRPNHSNFFYMYFIVNSKVCELNVCMNSC